MGKQFVAYIMEQVSGPCITLTGASEPFVTKEDDNADIFTPIRKQTGYLRILDETGGMLLEQIMPQNNTEKMVVLMEGEMVAWKGFLCAEAFTQPWDSDVNVLEFPIKSVLAALDDITVSASYSGSILRLSRMVAEGVNTLCAGEPFESVTHIGSIVASEWMIKKVNHSLFFNEESYQSGGDVVTTQEGMSYYRAIGEIMKTIGLTARQAGNRLYFVRYDTSSGYNIQVNTMSWQNFYNLAIEASAEVTQGTGLPQVDMLKSLSFRRANNDVTFNPGGRIAKVVLDILNIPATIFGLQLPETTEDETEVDQVLTEPLLLMDSVDYLLGNNRNFNIVYVQSHPIRTGGQETFTFNSYSHTYDAGNSRWIYNFLATGNFNDCFNNSPMKLTYFNDIGASLSNYLEYTNYNIVTGAFPVRWYFREKDSLNPISLVNGLFIMQKVLRGGDTCNWNNEECYSIVSPEHQNISNGSYLNIDFKCHCFVGYYRKISEDGLFERSGWVEASSFDKLRSRELKWGYDEVIVTEDVEFKMACALCVGGKWWNGSSWQDSGTTFYISFKGDSIVTNKETVGANVEGNGGWFIPVSSDMSGAVTFKIMSWCQTDYSYTFQQVDGAPYYDIVFTPRPYAKIIEGLAVGVTFAKTVTESERSTNTYRRVIMQSGFSEDKTIDLTIGTDNNNKDSTPSFLKDTDGTTNITSLQYYSGGNVVNERPEEHLLNRMATYYNQVRRAFKATVETGIDLLTTRYTYLGRYFFGIDKKHDWRNDEQEVKFIEVN